MIRRRREKRPTRNWKGEGRVKGKSIWGKTKNE
jgi:hypothetical protein